MMQSLSLEVEEARILHKMLDYSQEELKSLTDDINRQAVLIRDEEKEAVDFGVDKEDITKMEEFFKLRSIIHPKQHQ